MKKKLGKKPLLTLIATYDEHSSSFIIEGETPIHDIPSAMLRRNFPQAKTNTRLKIQFYPWEVDEGRTFWLKYHYSGEIYYTFSRKGKVIKSQLPPPLQIYLNKHLNIVSSKVLKLKMVIAAI